MKADRRPAKRVDAASSITLLYRLVTSPLDRYLPVSRGDPNSIRPVKIEHLALAVRDPEVSRAFYLETIGLDASAREKEWGIQLDFPDGFLMALIRDDPVPADVIDRVHFGCSLPRREDVATTRERLRAAGVPEVEWCDEPDYISVKVADPDGYVVELSYEVDG